MNRIETTVSDAVRLEFDGDGDPILRFEEMLGKKVVIFPTVGKTLLFIASKESGKIALSRLQVTLLLPYLKRFAEKGIIAEEVEI